MKTKTFKQMLKFALFSITALILQLGILAVFNEIFGWFYWISFGISIVFSVLWDYSFNKKYAFVSSADPIASLIKIIGFYVVIIPVSAIISSSSENREVSYITAVVIKIVLEYVYCSLFVYKNKTKHSR